MIYIFAYFLIGSWVLAGYGNTFMKRIETDHMSFFVICAWPYIVYKMRGTK